MSDKELLKSYFKNDEELTQRRIDAGAMVETTVMTLMTAEAVTNFSG